MQRRTARLLSKYREQENILSDQQQPGTKERSAVHAIIVTFSLATQNIPRGLPKGVLRKGKARWDMLCDSVDRNTEVHID